jgi:uncharacterized protein YdeI (YjbR/CyaY-like superfamily)
MPSRTLKTFEARDREQWREWLARHHDSESEVWLVFPKREPGRNSAAASSAESPCVTYPDALDEALCFGWIDSLVKRLDAERYARKFTPRKPDSRCSEINRKRFAELQASGRLTPAGSARAPTARDYRDRPKPTEPNALPPYIEQALRDHPPAWKHFDSLAPSYRRMYILWIDSAKQPETKARRLKEALGLLAAGKKLGLK